MKFPNGDWSLSNWNLPTGSSIEDVFFTSKDGTRLHGWYVSASNSNAPVLICIHGNAENVTRRRQWIEQLVRRGISIFAFDYRGYGQSEGIPVERGIYEDVVAGYKYLRNEKDIEPERISALGHSLGGAIAIELATRVPLARLIVESSFTSIGDMAAQIVPIFPFRLFLHSKYNSIRKVGRIRVPILFIHGDKDTVVPIRLGARLYAAANKPKSFYEIKDGGHGDIVTVGGIEYYERICDFIKTNI